jgi:RNA polymerase sigma-70 factor, ECF subfamily
MNSSPEPSVPGSGSDISDERELDLLRQVVERDRAAFKELYLIYHRRLARILMRVTSRYDVVEEVINDTMWIVWQKADTFRGDSRLSTWIIGIAYRCGLRALRKTSAIPPMHSDETLTAPDTQLANENSQWLDRALAELSSEQRMVLEFSYALGYSCVEIAQVMQCPVNTVKTRMFHARKRLRRALPRLAGSRE